MPPTPPSPPGLSLPEFGERLWGTGPEDAVHRLSNITLEDLQRLGLTQELAKIWRVFYEEQAKRGRGLPTSLLRVQLLDRCIELLG
jgi:hypothetical protein